MKGRPAGGGDRRAALTVPCHVSDRWLRFEEREQYEVLDEDLIQLDVMTRDDDGEPYKLCELVVARGDLLRAVAAYGDPPFRTTPVRRQEPAEARPARPRRKNPPAPRDARDSSEP
ncbi:MAG TPA: hypothetical protein VFZ24_02540 [Longimicrobiales bacterium]